MNNNLAISNFINKLLRNTRSFQWPERR